jgi:hypothetical protein
MAFKDRLRRLARLAEGDIIEIPQRDGTVARFPETAIREAYLNAMDRIGAGPDAPPRHPLLEAARNSSDPRWREVGPGLAAERKTAKQLGN